MVESETIKKDKAEKIKARISKKEALLKTL